MILRFVALLVAGAVVALLSWPFLRLQGDSIPGPSFSKHGASLSPVTCPTPHAPPPPSLHDPLTLSPSVRIPSALPDFDIDLFHDTAVCNAFSVRITRTDPDACARAETPERADPSEDPETTRWIRQARGPYTFSLRTDGAERLNVELSNYEGSCAYRLDVRLRNAGPVSFELWHMYEVSVH